jgi:BMFP domain-containing protein YqiC
MTQTSNRFFDEIGRLMNDAAGAAQGVKREVDTVMRNQAERILRDLDLVKREEFDAVKDMARLAREENEALKTRIAALEAKLGVSPSASGRTGRGAFCPPPQGRVRARKIPSFPCHFGALGLKARHVRSPRTPGGLLSDATGPRCGL